MEMKSIVSALLLVLPFIALNGKAQEPLVYDITKYGAKQGADISKALLDAWKEASAAENASKIVIPKGTWILSQVRLTENKAPLELEIQGTVQAYADPQKLPNKQGEWITINYVNYFTLSGGGVLDGQGHEAWKQNDCNKNKNCVKLPIIFVNGTVDHVSICKSGRGGILICKISKNLSLNFINNSVIHDLTTKDSKNFHVNCISSHNVTFQRFHVSAPGESINTDGLHLARSSLISVLDSVIETGDDCISIGDESSEFHIQNVTCGPGHGISIGSLGKGAQEKDVTGIYVKNCTFKQTQNGVRVKTWPSAPATLKVSNLHFEDLIMENVSNPIIIDQEYCPWNLCDKSDPSKIQISDVSVKNVRGTSSTAEVVTFACSSGKPCQNVEIGDIDLGFIGTIGNITTICSNVKPTVTGKMNPPLCASPPAAQTA
ncbi:pectin lyase-like superfamily protein [Striga asiatica]|uniref:Pectin lyase-like superfamily protein n=1 Tax=Striga asiatica TaxID=4170 RepID=A0A5A7PQ47_STRAF|nr:pectin lyase-like superfamily protein [Striga asiatica]